MVDSDPESRPRRAARLAADYGVNDRAGAGRYAAVVHRDGYAKLVRGDDIGGLLAQGELVSLIDLDYDASSR